MKKIYFLSAILIAFVILESCTKVPITGRRQFKLLPESMLMESSKASYQQMMSTSNVQRNSADAQMVRRVGERRVAAAEKSMKGTRYENRLKQFQWEFNLIQDNTVNAWAMPGGKIAFYTGILNVCQNETGIAVVMGHEIAHAIAQHGNERVSKALALNGLGTVLSVALADKPEMTRQAILLAYGAGTQVGVMLPFGRLHESESDEMGLMFMAMAGYDPREAPIFWDRMNKLSGQRPPELLSTHPGPEKRKEKLNKLMPKALKLYEQSGAKS